MSQYQASTANVRQGQTRVQECLAESVEREGASFGLCSSSGLNIHESIALLCLDFFVIHSPLKGSSVFLCCMNVIGNLMTWKKCIRAKCQPENPLNSRTMHMGSSISFSIISLYSNWSFFNASIAIVSETMNTHSTKMVQWKTNIKSKQNHIYHIKDRKITVLYSTWMCESLYQLLSLILLNSTCFL